MSSPQRPIYLDCNATTPVDPEVAKLVMHYMVEEFGNAGSRTHEYGLAAKKAVAKARQQVAAAMGCETEDVIFTSGATESNNLAILGLEEEGNRTKRRHIISTPIEHKAVLEPLARLAKRGFEVEFMPMDSSGAVKAEHLHDMLRPDTLLVSIMHANNETGVIQPIQECCAVLASHDAFFHVDSAQTAGKLPPLHEYRRISFSSISAHKFYGPKGVGALIARGTTTRQAITPIHVGGGQEMGLRPGTLPVPLIVGAGAAISLPMWKDGTWWEACSRLRLIILNEFRGLAYFANGGQMQVLPHVLNLSVSGVDAEALLVATKNYAAFSNGSACTSAQYHYSHVLTAMGLSSDRISSAIRLSWGPATSMAIGRILATRCEEIM
jgi:cysteine desulfurase